MDLASLTPHERARLAADPDTPLEVISDLASGYPEVLHIIGENPSCWPELREWIETFGDALRDEAHVAAEPDGGVPLSTSAPSPAAMPDSAPPHLAGGPPDLAGGPPNLAGGPPHLAGGPSGPGGFTATSAPPTPARRPRRAVLVAAVAVAVVLLVAGGAIAGRSIAGIVRGDAVSPGQAAPSSDVAEAEPDVVVNFGAAPTPAWRLSPADLGADSLQAPHPDPAAPAYASSVIPVIASRMTGSDRVVGVDRTTGVVVWSWTAPRSLWGCHAVGDGTWTACRGGSADGEESIDVLDTATGRSVGSVTPGFFPLRLAAIGDDLVIAGYRADVTYESCSIAISRRPMASPRAAWETVGKAVMGFCPTEAADESFSVGEESIGYALNGGMLVVDAATGEVRTDTTYGVQSAIWPDGWAAVTDGGWDGPNTTTVLDEDGAAAFRGPGWTWVPIGSPTAMDVVGIGTTAYARDGRALWEMSDPEPQPYGDGRGWTWVNVLQDVAVHLSDADYVTDATAAAVGYDLDSGRRLWEGRIEVGRWRSVSDDVVLSTDSCTGIASAFDPHTGQTLWSVGSWTEGPSCGGLWDSTLLAGDTLLKVAYPDLVAYRFETTGGDAPSSEQVLVTKCGRTPEFAPVRIRQADGRLAVTLRVTTRCPGGDFLATPNTQITVRDGTGTVASGVFDLTRSPVLVPADGEAMFTAYFPVGSFWRAPDDVDDSTVLVACVEDADLRAPEGSAPPAGVTTSAAGATASAMPPVSADAEQVAWEALRRQADLDRPRVEADLEGSWVAQLSSKRPGLEADGRTWDNQATYAEFLRLRLAYPEAVLTYSGDWTSYLYPDFWVTSFGRSFVTPEAANAWCEAEGFDAGHCYAKLVSSTLGPDGTTRNR